MQSSCTAGSGVEIRELELERRLLYNFLEISNVSGALSRKQHLHVIHICLVGKSVNLL